MSTELYPRNSTSTLDLDLFRKPTSEYRGTPFWSWNNKLNVDQLKRQIDWLKEMGMGGYHIHSRTGLDTPYMSREFLDIVKTVHRYGKERGMLTWLYDEDRWPSGFAGGLVTKDKTLRCKLLSFSQHPPGQAKRDKSNWFIEFFGGENAIVVARYEIVLKDGRLSFYKRLAAGESPSRGGRVFYAYYETATNSAWFNNQAYVDTLNPKAIARFIELTHEPYHAALGEDFGKAIPAIFTDEPQFSHKHEFRSSEATEDATMPWTPDFLDTYAAEYGQRLEEHLPEVFFELPDGKASVVRYRFHDHIAERFAKAFADQIGNWCAKHKIALTGHMMEEPTLNSQTAALGEAMRSYRSFQLPGIDMLCDSREYTTAKQAQSAVHQYGYPGVLSELYGVTGWDFDFAGHEAKGDWQAALGVTVRVHHLAWVSMAGEAKRDYPASIFYQSPWFREYPLVEDHFARLNIVLTRGRPVVRVGVVHPVESYWLCYGPTQQTRLERDGREQDFSTITKALLASLIDFNFICESQLPALNANQTGSKFTVGEMAYDAVVVPAMRTIRSTTLDRLEAFADAGGTVIFAGEIPSLVDAVPSDRPAALARRCRTISLNRPSLSDSLAAYRDVEVTYTHGGPVDRLLYQMRQDGAKRHVFFCNTEKGWGFAAVIRFKGRWQVTQLDTMSGETRALPAREDGGDTLIDWHFHPHDHILVTLDPGAPASAPVATPRPNWVEASRLEDPVPVTLSESNVLLLDQAQWRLNDEPWRPTEEVLRIENLLRERLGMPNKTGNIPQPWVDDRPADVLGRLSLRYTIVCDAPVAAPTLALEDAKDIQIELDGKRVASEVTGWWGDEAIQTVRMPALSAGTHELVLSYPYTRKTNVEWCYILGDFGVVAQGRRARIVAPVRQLAFGDWATQGLPFYGGNVTYHCKLDADGADIAIAVPKFKAPLLSVDLDGKPAGKIAFAPYRIDLGKLTKGSHRLDLTAFGSRINCFGQVHLQADNFKWLSPESWRTSGDIWAYEYQLKPCGVLSAPRVLRT